MSHWHDNNFLYHYDRAVAALWRVTNLNERQYQKWSAKRARRINKHHREYRNHRRRYMKLAGLKTNE